MRSGDLISRTRHIYREVMGEEPSLVEDFAPALQALVDGVTEVIVEIPWTETRGEESVERHQIVLRRLSEDGSRVVYYNPASRRDAAPGTSLGGGPQDGPPRRAEGEGMESMEVTALARWFGEGRAMALIPPPSFTEG